VNFLAHLWLADQTKTSFAGAILGDVVRGADLSAYPDEIARGIRLHRKIDAATDRHALIVAARQRFAQGQRRYAGIVLDLVCDYVLCGDWPRYSEVSLPDFCALASADVARASPWFVHAGGRATEAESFTRLLMSYATIGGIDHAIHRVAQRMRQPEFLLEAARDWNGHVELLQSSLPLVLNDLKTTGVPGG
jgi:acyl carrier protein phosphodiesterase